MLLLTELLLFNDNILPLGMDCVAHTALCIHVVV